MFVSQQDSTETTEPSNINLVEDDVMGRNREILNIAADPGRLDFQEIIGEFKCGFLSELLCLGGKCLVFESF